MKSKFTLLLLLLAIISFQLKAQSWSIKSDFGGTPRKEACGFAISNKGYLGTGDDGVKKKDFWEYNQNTDTWTQIADMPTTNGRDKACGFAIGTKGYVACGNDGAAYLNDCYEYDPLGNTWTAKANFTGTARQNAVGYSVGNKGYITCGYDGTDQKNDHYEFDPVANTWTAKANFGGGKREKAVGFGCTNAKGYVGTGWNGSTRTRDWWEYNVATNTWTQKTDFAGTQRFDAVGFSIGSKGYIGTGNDGVNRDDFWEYNPATDTWTVQADYIGTKRGKAVGLGIGSRGYVGTGEDDLGRSKTWHEFRPCDTWERKADFGGTPRAAAFGFAINGKGYMGTGYDGIAPETKDVWEYDSGSDTWTQVADFAGTARHSTYSFQIGNNGYVGGGWDGLVNNNDLWEYNQPTNTWTARTNLPAAGRIEALGLAINGKGYVGTGNTGSLQNDWYEYDPGTDSWTPKTNFPGTVRSGTAGFTLGNFGYVGTGSDAGGPTKDFYRFNPATDSWTAVADCGILKRTTGIGFTLCNKGYVVTGKDDAGNLLRECWEYDAVGNTWTQKMDYGGSPRSFASAFVIGCSAYVGLGITSEIPPVYSNELWEYRGCCCGGGVSSGGSGGVETKSLGDIIAKRFFGNAYNSLRENSISNGIKFTKSTTVANGVQKIELNQLLPLTIAGSETGIITSPTDIVNFSNAQDVMAVDYHKDNIVQAVAFGTKTIGSVYTHTKPVCDRLKGAQLIEVKNISIKGYDLVAYKIKQCSGEIEYAINLSAGVNSGNNKIDLQSNWFTDNYTNAETLYNFQLWAVSYDLVGNLASQIIKNIQSIAPIVQLPKADLPKTYITSGIRRKGIVTLNINNNSNIKNAVIEIVETSVEKGTENVRTIPTTLTSFGTKTVNIDIKDNYEATFNLLVNNKKTDNVYLNDGTWDIDGKNIAISDFTVNNDANTVAKQNEYRLMRNINFTASTSEYVNVYKTIGTKCNALKLNGYNSIKFNTNINQIKSVKITLIDDNITEWNNQYSYNFDVTNNGEVVIDLSNFISSKYSSQINERSISGVCFSFISNNKGLETSVNASISNLRFSTDRGPFVLVAQKNNLLLTPNPSSNNFRAIFNSNASEKMTLQIINASSGKVVYVKNNIEALKGDNQLNVDLNAAAIPSGLYIISLSSKSQNFTPSKLVINN